MNCRIIKTLIAWNQQSFDINNYQGTPKDNNNFGILNSLIMYHLYNNLCQFKIEAACKSHFDAKFRKSMLPNWPAPKPHPPTELIFRYYYNIPWVM